MKFPIIVCMLPLSALWGQTPAPKAAPAKPAAAKPAPAKPAPAKPAAEAKEATPPAGDPVILVAGDEQMTRSQFEAFIDGLPEQVREQARGPAKRQLAEQIVELKILAQEARRRKVDQKPSVQAQVTLQVERALAQALIQDMLANAATSEEALKALYEKSKDQHERVKARHILIRFQGSRVPLKPDQKDLTEAEALAKTQEIRKRLLAGEDFAAVAKAESDDTGSGANGGDLGQFGRGQMVPEFEDAAFKLKTGELSEPVRTPFGYHLIKVDEHSSRGFEEVKGELEQQLKPEYVKSLIEELKRKTPVVIDEKYFGAAAPRQP